MTTIENSEKARVFAIAGGKGGVGKTVLAASMGMGLAMLHKEVILIDADFGGANLHRVLGMESEIKSAVHFLQRKVKYLNETIIPHPTFQNLKFIRGMNGVLGAANLNYGQKMKLIRHISHLTADYIILDLSAGSDYHVLDFFLSADVGVVVVTPDPLSILEGYHFIKQAFFRKLLHLFRNNGDLSKVIDQYAHAGTQNRQASINAMIDEIGLINTAISEKIIDMQKHFIPRLLINRIVKGKDENDCLAVKIAARELLSIDVEYWGAIHDDSVIYDALLSSQPFIGYNNKCRASRDLATIIITKMLRRHHMPHRALESIRQNRIKKENSVCSVHCQFWQTCEFKRGGYPCDLVKV